MWLAQVTSPATWPEQLCLPHDGSRPLQGHLSDNMQVEAVLQGLLLLGPAVWLLVGAAFRIVQLRRAKLVVVPNRRLYVKIVCVSS